MGANSLRGPAWTAFRSDGRIAAIVGIDFQMGFRGAAWALLADNLRSEMLAIARHMRAYLRETEFRRIDAYIDDDWPEAARLVQLIGFRLEHPGLEAWGPYGQTQALYGWVR